MIRVVAVFGPTASGKSSLGLLLAEKFNGAVVSVDSMQLYRGMDIGTAKPTAEEQARIPHYMIDCLNPEDSFSVYDFKLQAENSIRHIAEQGKLPILVGGTGLYFDAMFNNTQFGEMKTDPRIHHELTARAESEGGEALLDELRKIDPLTAAPLHARDLKRIVRGLEVYYTTGKTLTEFKNESHKSKCEFDFLKLQLMYRSRDILYERINRRVDLMLEQGLIDEAQSIYSQSLMSGTSSQAIGYKELLPYLQGESTLEECIEHLKMKTRNYAKRQITWFKRYSDSVQIFMDSEEDPALIAEQKVKNFLKGEWNES